MDKIFHAYISYNSGRVSGSGSYDIGYFRFPINAWARIIGKVENSIIDGFVKNYRKGNETIEKKLIVDLSNISEWDKKERKWYLATEDWAFVYRTKETYLNKEVIFLRIYRNLPKTPNKLFTNVEEMLAYYKKENDKRNAKITAEHELHKATKSIVLDCSHENTSCPNTHYNGADLYITNCDDFAENWNEFDFIII